MQNSSLISAFWQGKVKTSSPISALLRWRHFRLSLSLSLSLCTSLYLSLSHRAYVTHNIGSASALPIMSTQYHFVAWHCAITLFTDFFSRHSSHWNVWQRQSRLLSSAGRTSQARLAGGMCSLHEQGTASAAFSKPLFFLLKFVAVYFCCLFLLILLSLSFDEAQLCSL